MGFWKFTGWWPGLHIRLCLSRYSDTCHGESNFGKVGVVFDSSHTLCLSGSIYQSFYCTWSGGILLCFWFSQYIYIFFSLSSRDLTGLFLFVADVDGEYGVFSSWTGSYALSNNHFVLPFNDCCCSRFCRTLHSQQDPFLEWNSEALLRLLWRADNVSSLFFVILTCRPVVYVLLVFAAYGIMYACMGINHCWIICSLYKLCFRVPFWAKKKGRKEQIKY